jgi:hypothetical protein
VNHGGANDGSMVWVISGGVELMHMIRKCQFPIEGTATSVADQFYALAGLVRPT